MHCDRQTLTRVDRQGGLVTQEPARYVGRQATVIPSILQPHSTNLHLGAFPAMGGGGQRRQGKKTGEKAVRDLQGEGGEWRRDRDGEGEVQGEADQMIERAAGHSFTHSVKERDRECVR